MNEGSAKELWAQWEKLAKSRCTDRHGCKRLVIYWLRGFDLEEWAAIKMDDDDSDSDSDNDDSYEE